ncbi:MAG: D-alanyl-D-alanine carboxypeptidase [Rhodobacterales bacterium CG_4_9_14_3_um_filter_71_31]|nr:MAG: D-alanyl-D-alanine carboxypeptidase [Rhodobacterales bacterium CG_4_9_14_3_um_filter_71_31]
MRRIVSRLAAVLALATLAGFGPAQALDTPARAALVLDLSSGAVLLEKNADQPLPPASMSKLMTLNMVFEAIADGRLSLEDRFPVSETAWRMGGSKMFVHVGDRIRVEDLLYGVTVQSGNDACIVLAEGLAGTEAAFAARMNARAPEIGLTNSHFENATGWPGDNHVMSVRDLARLASRIVTEFPQFHPYFSVREFTWEGITQANRNPLLGLDIGADGMKTGHTEAAGYGLVATLNRDGRRVVVVLSGLSSMSERRIEAEKLANWAYREFRTGALYRAGEAVAEAEVWIGAAPRVGLAPASDLVVTVPVADADRIRARVRYDGPVRAPIAKGQHIADLIVETPGVGAVSYPLLATADVAAGGVVERLTAAARLLLARLMAPEAS